MKKILFLVSKDKGSKIIQYAKDYSKHFRIVIMTKKVTYSDLSSFDNIFSFCYRHIIEKDIIAKLKNPIINLHISYLPFNRGAHPNFWAFIDNTINGISIHEMDKGIDTGNIIIQKQIDFQLLSNKNKLTFKNTYELLIENIETLFVENFIKILNKDYKTNKQIGNGSFHLKKQLPSILKDWNQNIYKTVVNYERFKNKELNRQLDIIAKIEETRKENNINWMNIVRESLKSSPEQTIKILKKINTDDKQISNLFKALVKKN